MTRRLATAAAVFAAGVIGLSLFAWERLREPSPQFHFVDLAHSFLRGRLDTDTPRAHWKALESDPFAPRGFAAAVKRQTTNPDGSARGWNDWSSFRILTLRSGETLEGVFPWWDLGDRYKGQKDARQSEFRTLSGDTSPVDCRRDVATGCTGDQAVRFYVSFPPFPAVLMVPLAAVFGYRVNDVWFVIFFGALNGLILFLLLRSLAGRGISDRSCGDDLWVTALFVFGTVHFFSAVRGEVWFTALVVGVTFNLLAIWCAIGLARPLLAGLFVACGMATRTPLAFSALLVGLLVLFPDGRLRRADWGRAAKVVALFAVPVGLGLAALMAYNRARFGHGFEFGHTYLQEGTRDSVRRHGLMSFWFLGQNLSAAFLNPPVFTTEEGSFLRITKHGLGLLWTTPVLFLLPSAPKKTPLFKALVLTALAVALPGLFYQNTGWEQFGYRFGLDWLPFLVVAFALGGTRLTWPVKVLILVGIAVNGFGAATFGRANGFYY